ncbi:MAG: S-methyl-5'-thioadenosine phosphorylase [Acidimicrobiales bacterium]
MKADIGVFGGSGFYDLLNDATAHELDTPFGAPSAPMTIGTVGDRTVAFLPRHGTHHRLPPHAVPYRANVAAMRALGVRALLAPFAAGSLRPDVHPGDLVVVDQLVDRTWGRADTFHDTFPDGPQHVSLADPYDEPTRRALLDAVRAEGATVHDHGTVVVIQGPRFATRAESQWYRSAGWDVINMTQYPETALAREAGIAYAGIALITDYDTGLEGVDGIEPVSQDAVFAAFEANLDVVRAVLLRAIASL